VREIDKITWSKSYPRLPREGTGVNQDHLGKEQEIYKTTLRKKKRYLRSPGEGGRDIQDHLEKEQ
jgi:hypothetical protein